MIFYRILVKLIYVETFGSDDNCEGFVNLYARLFVELLYKIGICCDLEPITIEVNSRGTSRFPIYQHNLPCLPVLTDIIRPALQLSLRTPHHILHQQILIVLFQLQYQRP